MGEVRPPERGVEEEGGPAGVGGDGSQWDPLRRVAGNTTSRTSDPDWEACCNLVEENDNTSVSRTHTQTHRQTHRHTHTHTHTHTLLLSIYLESQCGE